MRLALGKDQEWPYPMEVLPPSAALSNYQVRKAESAPQGWFDVPVQCTSMAWSTLGA